MVNLRDVAGQDGTFARKSTRMHLLFRIFAVPYL
jgi:hypothetical protein